MDSNSSASDSSSSSDSDEEQALLTIQLAMQNTMEFIHSNEWEEGGQELVNPQEGVCDVLRSMMATLGLFKILTNFSIPEFVKLCNLVCPTIVAHARSTGAICVLLGRPSKLSPEQRLLGFLLYIKHDPTSSFPSFLWNWSKTSFTSDQVFIANCVSWALRNEIRWLNVMER